MLEHLKYIFTMYTYRSFSLVYIGKISISHMASLLSFDSFCFLISPYSESNLEKQIFVLIALL